MQSSPEQNPISTGDGKPEKKPWPMWPIGLAILAFIALYTWVNIKYRKPGEAFEPNQAMQERRKAIVEKNFYDWYRLEATSTKTPSNIEPKAEVRVRSIGGPLEKELPEQLVYYIPNRPTLLPLESSIVASSSIVAGQPIQLQLSLPSELVSHSRFRLQAFYKEQKLYLLLSFFAPALEEANELLSTPMGIIEFLIPSDPIEPGSAVDVILFSQDQARSWQIHIESALPEE